MKKIESWTDLARAATDLRARINARIDAEVESMRQHCHGVPAASLRVDVMRGSNDLLSLAEWYGHSIKGSH